MQQWGWKSWQAGRAGGTQAERARVSNMTPCGQGPFFPISTGPHLSCQLLQGRTPSTQAARTSQSCPPYGAVEQTCSQAGAQPSLGASQEQKTPQQCRTQSSHTNCHPPGLLRSPQHAHPCHQRPPPHNPPQPSRQQPLEVAKRNRQATGPQDASFCQGAASVNHVAGPCCCWPQRLYLSCQQKKLHNGAGPGDPHWNRKNGRRFTGGQRASPTQGRILLVNHLQGREGQASLCMSTKPS